MILNICNLNYAKAPRIAAAVGAQSASVMDDKRQGTYMAVIAFCCPLIICMQAEAPCKLLTCYDLPT